MIMPIYICDDVPELLEQYEKIISNTILIEEYPMRIAGAFSTPEKLLDTLKIQIDSGNECGIYFLDIDLKNEINGFMLAKEIRKIDSRGFIIFITTYGNLALETFRHQLEAMDFIVKDNPTIIHDRIKSCLKHAYERKLMFKADPVFYMYNDDQKIYYNESDIICICASKKPHHIEIITKKRQDTLRGSLKEIKDKLSDAFVFCHRSSIINTHYISSIDYSKRKVHMVNDMILHASYNNLSKLP